MDFPKQKITLYHKDTTNKVYVKYSLIASVRDTSIQNRNKTGVSSTDRALIRIFASDNNPNSYEVEKGDLIVNKDVNDTISYEKGNDYFSRCRSFYRRGSRHRDNSIRKF